MIEGPSSSFIFKRLAIQDVILIQPKVIRDVRGYFMETYRSSAFKKHGIPDFLQENHSYSNKNVLRGLHYQADPNGQGKLIRCIKGEIFDVAVDVRKDSPTHYSWVGATLSQDNNNELYIPQGFAHGFCVLSGFAEIVYKCTREYSPLDEMGILWNDQAIGIDWPISSPILSIKDANYPRL